MKRVFLPILLLIVLASCRHKEIAAGTPKCIYKYITEHSKDPEWMVGSVKEFEFQGRLVYAFEPDTRKIADGSTTVRDGNCNALCDVGGFGGLANNQCNGGNFFKESVYKRTIWEKK